jgi:putative heme-binding domain-containing protein
MLTVLRSAFCLSAFLAAQHLAQAQTNAFDTPEGIAQGTTLFQSRCTYCHGAHGEGGRGPDLTSGAYRHGSTNAALFSAVRNGISGTEMPAVGFTDDESWKVVAFLKKLGSAGPMEKAPGDAPAGQRVFEGKGGCLTCHTAGHGGGSVGPDLSEVGARRNLKYLEESLVKPEADVPIRYRGIQVITKAGQTIAGVRINEDDLSIQFRDTSDNIRSFLKTDVKEIRFDKPSLMPAYGSVLSKKEIEDLVAYLNSLRGAE